MWTKRATQYLPLHQKLTVLSVCVRFYLHNPCSTQRVGRFITWGKKDQFRFGTIFKRVWVCWAQYSIQVHNIISAQRRRNAQRTLLEFKRRRQTKKATVSNGFVGTFKRFKYVKRADFAIMEKKAAVLCASEPRITRKHHDDAAASYCRRKLLKSNRFSSCTSHLHILYMQGSDADYWNRAEHLNITQICHLPADGSFKPEF